MECCTPPWHLGPSTTHTRRSRPAPADPFFARRCAGSSFPIGPRAHIRPFRPPSLCYLIASLQAGSVGTPSVTNMLFLNLMVFWTWAWCLLTISHVFHSAMPPVHTPCFMFFFVAMFIACWSVLAIRCDARFASLGLGRRHHRLVCRRIRFCVRRQPREPPPPHAPHHSRPSRSVPPPGCCTRPT